MEQRVPEPNAGTDSDTPGPLALGKWLEKRCQEEHLSLRQAAAKTDVSHATIADIINGKRPSPETVIKLAKAFGGDGHHQEAALEDLLLTLCGYRSNREEEDLSEPLAQLIDKLSQFNDEQLKIMGHFADFITEKGGK